MSNKALVLVGGTLVAVALSGCPVKDDYFLESDAPDNGVSGSSTSAGTGASAAGGTESVIPNNGGNGDGAAAQGGSSPGSSGSGAQASGGTTGGGGGSSTGGNDVGGSAVGGSAAGGTDPVGGVPSDAGAPSEGGAGGTPEPACDATTERCNGIDDDCDGSIDDSNVCPNGCSGFVIDESSGLGYMYCVSRKDFQHARDACNDQSMHLVWVDSISENQLVSEHLDALGDDTEVLIGASDQQKEGDWVWYGGGALFWKGNQNGNAVNGAFVAWAPGVPDSFGGNEDCAVLNPTTQRWSDRSCSATFSYVCESEPVKPMPAPPPR